jgi:hypothetical protein
LEKWDFKAGNREITVLPALIGTAKYCSELNPRHFKSGDLFVFENLKFFPALLQLLWFHFEAYWILNLENFFREYLKHDRKKL